MFNVDYTRLKAIIIMLWGGFLFTLKHIYYMKGGIKMLSLDKVFNAQTVLKKIIRETNVVRAYGFLSLRIYR